MNTFSKPFIHMHINSYFALSHKSIEKSSKDLYQVKRCLVFTHWFNKYYWVPTLYQAPVQPRGKYWEVLPLLKLKVERTSKYNLCFKNILQPRTHACKFTENIPLCSWQLLYFIIACHFLFLFPQVPQVALRSHFSYAILV